MKKIFKIIYYLVLAAIAVTALFLILSVVPIKGGYKTLVVLSGSMEPKIHTGSVVAIKAEKEYKIGDVITFGENTKTKTPTTHRIFEIKETDGMKSYITKGDANNAPDQKPVSEKEILGKVLFSVSYVGYAVAAAQKPIGFLLIVVVPAVIIIYEEAQNIKKEIIKKIDYKKRVKKREENMNNADEKTEEKI
ncbi:MAG TPA: signal peptidase I [Candidatus Moranbacteria bacterium]|nr:signal peptidase I [Candidatus Moranbacteria bacterium]